MRPISGLPLAGREHWLIQILFVHFTDRYPGCLRHHHHHQHHDDYQYSQQHVYHFRVTNNTIQLRENVTFLKNC